MFTWYLLFDVVDDYFIIILKGFNNKSPFILFIFLWNVHKLVLTL
jgi:hypothetical protein